MWRLLVNPALNVLRTLTIPLRFVLYHILRCRCRFSSHLPGGSASGRRGGAKGGGYCILDCVFHEVDQTFFVLDMMAWKVRAPSPHSSVYIFVSFLLNVRKIICPSYAYFLLKYVLQTDFSQFMGYITVGRRARDYIACTL